MANSRKPDLLKIISSTYRESRAQNTIPIPVVTEIPRMPEWMVGYEIATKEWDRLAKILSDVGILTEAGLNALAVMCMLLQFLVEAFKANECPPANMIAQYRNLINDFGITPVAQTRVKANGGEKEKNSFDGVGKRPERLRKNSA